MLEIRLLGKYEVRRDGVPVEIASRPAKLLLAYLALTAGTPHPRERVAGILWPDSGEASARGNLRQALWRLRKAIGDRYLFADNKTVAFERDPDFWLDTATLEDPTNSNLLAAVSAYKGELLPGFYEDWVLLERGRLEAAFERKLQRLLDSLVQKKEWPEALKWAEHWIAFGQVPEPAFRVLMTAHAAQGNLAAVADDYERCLSLLQLDLGVDPSEETQTLYESLLRGERPTILSQATQESIGSEPRPRHNLPQQSTPFIGRERELAEARQLLSANRLLTILGPGGMGKTRLALELAGQLVERYSHGIYFVSLAPIDSVGYLIQTIAEAIGFPLSTDEEPKHQLLRHLRNRQYLLLMDNFDHLLDGAGLIAEILQATREVTILITTRERLNLHEESLLSIDGLAYPSSPAMPEALDYAAVRMFVDSARRLRPGFELRRDNQVEVTRICQMVQGMPLGILLAAAWVDMLSPAEIASEMSRSLDFLQTEWRDMPERHRSVQAAFESSWRRLTETQRELLAKLAIFRGGFTPEAAREVTGASLQGLASLVHKSLIRRDLESGRYGIHELLRQFAWERLEAKPRSLQAVSQAHAEYFADFMEERWAHLTDSRQLAAMAEIEADLENVRQAWRYWLKRQDAGRIGQFFYSFWQVHEVRGWSNAGARLFADAAAALRPALAGVVDADLAASINIVYAHALAFQSYFMAHFGDVEEGLSLAQESVTILQNLDRIDLLIQPLVSLRWNANYAGFRIATMDIGWESIKIVRERGDEWMLAYALCGQGREAGLLQEYELAERLIKESLRLFEEHGDFISTTWPAIELGNAAIRRGAYDEARQYYERALRACEGSGFQWGRVKATRYVGIGASITGEYETARAYLRQSLKLADELGLPHDVVNVLYEIAVVEAASGARETAVRLLTLIQNHPLSDHTRTISLWTGSSIVRFQDLANELLVEMKDHLPPESYAMAIERGRASTLDSVVLELLATQS